MIDSPTRLERKLEAFAKDLERAERQSFTLAGTFRIYFNRHQAAPLVWCVATEHLELAVAEIVFEAPTRTVYRPKATPDDEDGKPSAWLEVDGVLIVEGKRVRILRGG